MITNEFINGAVYDALKGEVVELENGYSLKPIETDKLWESGVELYKDDEFIENYVLDDYCESLADLLEQGQYIVETIADEIAMAIESTE